MVEIENRGPQLLTVCVTLLTFALVSISLRCVTRIAIVKSFGIDDWLMVAAAVSYTLFCTCALEGIVHGTGRHAADLKPAEIEEAMMYWWLCYVWYAITMIVSKLSIGVFLLRITVDRIFRYILYGAMLISGATGVVFFFVTMLQCHPVSYFWNQNQPGGCIDIHIIAALTYLYSAFSVIADFTFALLPMWMIKGLQMSRRTKIALVPILGMACVASIAVGVRFAYVKDFYNPDFLWATLDIAIWSTVEQGLAITAGSLATLRPLVRVVGKWCGIERTRSGTPGPSSGLPPTIGSIENAKKASKGHSALASYDMTTFDVERGDESTAAPRKFVPRKSQIYMTKEVAVSTSKGSIWDRSAGSHDDSEEELTPKRSKETCGGLRAYPKSFLDVDPPEKQG